MSTATRIHFHSNRSNFEGEPSDITSFETTPIWDASNVQQPYISSNKKNNSKRCKYLLCFFSFFISCIVIVGIGMCFYFEIFNFKRYNTYTSSPQNNSIGYISQTQILQNDPEILRLKNKLLPFFPEIKNTVVLKSDQSYTIEKYKIHLCIEDETGKVYDDNMLIYVFLHELAHCINGEVGHGDKFEAIFQTLLYRAEKYKLYDPKKPRIKNYCPLPKELTRSSVQHVPRTQRPYTPVQTVPIEKQTVPVQTVPTKKRPVPVQTVPIEKRPVPVQTVSRNFQITDYHKKNLKNVYINLTNQIKCVNAEYYECWNSKLDFENEIVENVHVKIDAIVTPECEVLLHEECTRNQGIRCFRMVCDKQKYLYFYTHHQNSNNWLLPKNNVFFLLKKGNYHSSWQAATYLSHVNRENMISTQALIQNINYFEYYPMDQLFLVFVKVFQFN